MTPRTRPCIGMATDQPVNLFTNPRRPAFEDVPAMLACYREHFNARGGVIYDHNYLGVDVRFGGITWTHWHTWIDGVLVWNDVRPADMGSPLRDHDQARTA